jgi:hypothetical protein
LEDLPLALLDSVPEADRSAVRRWWTGLSGTDRRQVTDLYDDRYEAYLFTPAAGDDAPPAVSGGHFLAADDAWRFADWEADWREYLVEHPPDDRGDRWAVGSVVLTAQFRSFCWLGDEPGVRCRVADWRLTRFAPDEWPPSEQYRGRTPHRT